MDSPVDYRCAILNAGRWQLRPIAYPSSSSPGAPLRSCLPAAAPGTAPATALEHGAEPRGVALGWLGHA